MSARLKRGYLERTVCTATGVGMLTSVLMAANSQAAVTLTTLVSFDGTNGATPLALAPMDDGGFFGTTHYGGPDFTGPPPYGFFGSGTLFRISPDGAFSNLAHNVGQPTYMMRAGDGNYYGSLQSGGLFRLTSEGVWTRIFSFPAGGASGSLPTTLAEGSDGGLFGITQFGGSMFPAEGTVFRFGTNGSFQSLVHFAGTNGSWPSAMVRGQDGNFYGITQQGGELGHGVVFRMTSAGSLQVLWSLQGTNGSGGIWLLQSSDGCLYGTTYQGGQENNGVVFKVNTNGAFVWSFPFHGTNGSDPLFLMQASDGGFYGTTDQGGPFGGGTVFRITSDGDMTTVFSFAQTNGAGPFFLLQGPDGNLYGTTQHGGPGGFGTVFRLSVPMAPVFQQITHSNGTLALTWSAVAGQNYQLEYNSDLSSTNWTNLGGPTLATNGTMTVADVAGAPQRFYRVVLLP